MGSKSIPIMTLSSLFDHPSITESFLHDEQLSLIYCLSVSGHSFVYDLSSKEYQLISWSLRSSKLQIITDDSTFMFKCTEQNGASLSMTRYDLISGKWKRSNNCVLCLVETSVDSILRDRRKRDLGALKTWAPGAILLAILGALALWYF